MTYPQVIVEAGFEPTGPGVTSTDLLLDDATYGRLGTGTLADATTWTDVSTWVQQGSVSRPFTRQQGPLTTYQGGTATLTLNNSDGRFDPQNLNGPYVSAGATQVRPMIPVRVRAVYNGVTYYLFSGFAVSWTPPAENFGPNYDQVTLACADAFRVFTGVKLAPGGAAGGGEDSGARISRILTAAGWYASARNRSAVSAGSSTVQATTLGSDALSLMQLTTDSEVGELYMDGQGRATFRSRHDVLTDSRSATVQAVFGTGSTAASAAVVSAATGTAVLDSAGGQVTDGSATGVTELPCTALSRPDDDTTLANDIQATIAGSTAMQEAKDTASIAAYLFARTYAREDLILETDTAAGDWAHYVLTLAKGSEYRIDQVTVTPGVSPDALFPQALGRELGDRIEVWKKPPNVAAYSKELFVRGITHSFAPLWWQTRWDTQSAERYSFFVLDDTSLGTLGSNALAF